MIANKNLARWPVWGKWVARRYCRWELLRYKLLGMFPTADNVLVTLASWQSPTNHRLTGCSVSPGVSPLSSLPPAGCSSWCAAHNRELSRHSSPSENKPQPSSICSLGSTQDLPELCFASLFRTHLLWVELCPPWNSYAEVLTPSTLWCCFIWKWGHHRCN